MKTKMEKFAILSLSWMLISTYSVSTALPAMKEYYIEYSGSQVEFLVSAAALGITFTILFNTVIAKYLKERQMVAGGLLLLSVSGVVQMCIRDSNISCPWSVTRTRSSTRTPISFSRYTPGSIEKIFPGTALSAEAEETSPNS